MNREIQNRKKMPVLFIGHGSPMNALEDNDYTIMLKKLGDSLLRPQAILIISAHWETTGTWVTGMEAPKTIHDFFGFPEELYSIHYPAKGSSDLALRLKKGISCTDVQIDECEWGLDHGAWSILRHMYPDADIPVVQLSIAREQPNQFHFELGRQLSSLREQGVMIIGSGNVVHNLRQISWERDARPYEWAVKFDTCVKEKLLERSYEPLMDEFLNTEVGKRSHPTIEHYLPLLYVLGASRTTDVLNFEYEGIQNASMSMRSFGLY